MRKKLSELFMALIVPAMFFVAGLFCCMNVAFSASALSGNGAGVYVGKSSTFNFSSGSISGFNTTDLGGGIFVDSGGIFNMTGGTISRNTATKGGGVYVSTNGTFTLNGGEISGNTATEGSGVNVYNGGTFVMNGGTVGKSGSPALFYNFYNTTTKLYCGNFYENIYSYSNIETKVEANITGLIEFVETGILTVQNYSGITPTYTIRLTSTRGVGAVVVLRGGSETAPDLSKIKISGYDTNNYVISCEKDSDNIWTIGLSRRVTSVKFNPNGGSCDTASKNVYYGDAYGNLPSASRSCFTFGGWSKNFFDAENSIFDLYNCTRNGTTFTMDTGSSNTDSSGASMWYAVQTFKTPTSYVGAILATTSSGYVSAVFTKDSSFDYFRFRFNGNVKDGGFFIDISKLPDGDYVFHANVQEISVNHMVVKDIMIEQNAGNVATDYTNDVVSTSTINNNLFSHTLFARWNPIYIDVNVKNLSGETYEGTVMGTNSASWTGRYKLGDTITISYSPNGNFSFDRICKGTTWNSVNIGTTYTITEADVLSGSVDFRICYDYYVNLYAVTDGTVSDGTGGLVKCYEGQSWGNSNGNGWAYYGPAPQYVYAKVNTGYVFEGWFASSDCSGTALSTSLTYTFTRSTTSGNISLYAKFTAILITVTIKNLSGAGYEGSVNGNESGIYTAQHKIGDVVPILYTPKNNFSVDMVCKGNGYSYDTKYDLDNYTITAEDIENGLVYFTICYNFYVFSYAATNGTLKDTTGGLVSCEMAGGSAEGMYGYEYSGPHETATVCAYPKNGYRLEGWYRNEACSGNPVSTSETYSFEFGTETGFVYLYAKFVPKKITLTLDATKDGKTLVSAGTTKLYYYYNTNIFYSDEACTSQISVIEVPKINGYTLDAYLGDGTKGGNQGELFIYGNRSSDKQMGEIAGDLYCDIYDDATLKANYVANKVKITLDPTFSGKTLLSTGTDCFYYIYDQDTYYSDEACTTSITKITLPTLNGYTIKWFICRNEHGGGIDEGYVRGYNDFGAEPGSIAGDLYYDVYEDCTLYAVWSANKIKITFDPSYYDFTLTSSGTAALWFYFDTNTYYSDEACTTTISSVSLPSISKYTFLYYYGNGTCGGDNGERYIYGYQDDGTVPGAIASDLCTDIYQDAILYAKYESNDKTFPTTWGNEISTGSGANMTTTVDASGLTSIKFMFEIPTNYAYIGKLSTGLKVYQDLSNSKAIAFVTDGIITAPQNCGSLFSGLMELDSLQFNNFKTSLVTNMSSMFAGCLKLTSINVTAFDTLNVTDMASMFSNCSYLTSLDISNFNTAKVTNMSYMFSDSSSLVNLDLSNFDTSLVTNMSGMFYYCTDLKTLNLSSFNMARVTSCSDMLNFMSGNRIGNIKTPYNNSVAIAITTDSTLMDISTRAYVTGVTAATNPSRTFAREVTFTLDVYGGDALSTTSYVGWYGEVYSGSLPTPTKSGYNFQGWYSEASGGSSVSNYKLTDGTIFYAHWSKSGSGGGITPSWPGDYSGGGYYEGDHSSPELDGEAIDEGVVDDILNIFNSFESNTFSAGDVNAFSIINESGDDVPSVRIIEDFGDLGYGKLAQVRTSEHGEEWHLAIITSHGLGFDQYYYYDPEFFDKILLAFPNLEFLDIRGLDTTNNNRNFSLRNLGGRTITVWFPQECNTGFAGAYDGTLICNPQGSYDPGSHGRMTLTSTHFQDIATHFLPNSNANFFAIVSRFCPEAYGQFKILEDCGTVDGSEIHLYRVSCDGFNDIYGSCGVSMDNDTTYAIWSDTMYLDCTAPLESNFISDYFATYGYINGFDLRGVGSIDNQYGMIDMAFAAWVIKPASGTIDISCNAVYNYKGEQVECFAPATTPSEIGDLEIFRGSLNTFTIKAKDLDIYIDDKKWFDPKKNKIQIKTQNGGEEQ